MEFHRTTLEDRKEAAEGTITLSFKKPEGFQYEAGQFINVTLINPPEIDSLGSVRAFTLSSAPYEKYLMITVRVRDTAFKHSLKTIPAGTEIEIEGPYGNLTLHANPAQPAVFLAGGVGITPFRSIALQAIKDNRPHRLYLFYANRHTGDAAFLDELQALEKRHDNFKLIATMTKQTDKSDRTWQGERGHINKEMLLRHINDTVSCIYYTAGPPAMISAMQNLLHELGIKDTNIRAEQFSGY